MRSVRVLILQNSISDAAQLAHGLNSKRFRAEVARDFAEAVHRAGNGGCDVLIIDDVVGEHRGASLCWQLRAQGSNVPIVFVSANQTLACRVAAFRSGADDFVSRPYDPNELMLRLQAVLRRSQSRTPPAIRCRVGLSIVDVTAGEVIRDQRRLRLTAKERHLFSYLWSRREQVVSRAELLRTVWDYSTSNSRTVEVHIASLRRKLEVEPHRPKHLVTLRGRGYVLSPRLKPAE